MPRCFVIQPFDGGPFDKRYTEVVKPAIEKSGFESYRVDRDPSVEIPIESITGEISASDYCVADISEDNPNVWFELGYAMAKGRSVLMICKADRRERFPFDIQHRTVVRYGTESTSDFDFLSKEIVSRLSAFAKSDKAVKEAVAASSVQLVEGHSPYEIAILVYLLENRLDPEDGEAGYHIQQGVQRSGFTKAAIGLGLEKLRINGYISKINKEDRNNEPFSIYTLGSKGIQWLISNESKLVLTQDNEVEDTLLEYDPFADS